MWKPRVCHKAHLKFHDFNFKYLFYMVAKITDKNFTDLLK